MFLFQKVDVGILLGMKQTKDQSSLSDVPHLCFFFKDEVYCASHDYLDNL